MPFIPPLPPDTLPERYREIAYRQNREIILQMRTERRGRDPLLVLIAWLIVGLIVAKIIYEALP